MDSDGLNRDELYSLQGTRKTLEGAAHPDRDAQFRYINRCVKVFQRAGQPVISVDAKKGSVLKVEMSILDQQSKGIAIDE